MVASGLPSRHIRTRCPGLEPFEGHLTRRLHRTLRDGSRGGSDARSQGTREPFVTIVKCEEELANIAAVAGMASSDVGGCDRRGNICCESGHQVRGERQVRLRAEKERQPRG